MPGTENSDAWLLKSCPAVTRRLTLVAVVVLVAVVAVGISAAASAPYFVSAAASRGHIVAVYNLGDSEDTAPGQIAVAVSPQTQTDGSFVAANVRVQESIVNVTKVATGQRYRTQHKLRPGPYYVKVSSRALGLDCTPLKPCMSLWSNARRVIIPPP